MRRVVNVCPCVYGQVKCPKCKISSDIGWYKTNGNDIFCPICDFKVGYFQTKKERQESEDE